ESVNRTDISNLACYVPCLKEQTKIANFLSNIDSIVEKEKQKLESLRIWKKGLLQQMFV
ncbi:MAG: restriction endonuclease subunit S, partial [Clostridium sp.]